MGRLPDAIQEMEKIITQYGTRNPKAVSDAARTLGATCAAVVEKPGAGLQPADVEAYRGSATGYLKLAIDVYPDQPFADYEAIGDKLMALGDYANAAQILAQGRTRCSPPAPVQRSALAKEADCCFNIRQWERALGRYKQLDESVKDDREKGLAFKENIGLCYENMGMWDQALSEAWNVLDANLPRTSPKWFEARAHQVHCLAMLKDDAGAWKNFAEVIRSTWPAVGGPEIKKQFDDLLERDLPTHKAEYEALTKGLPERK
jgi:tetratricopeptide (TPR) repeat protein